MTGPVQRLRVPVGDVAALVAADSALKPLRSPEIACDVDVTAPRPDGRPGWARLRCRHGLRGDRVASTATADGAVEVAAYAVEHWQTELARAATVSLPGDAPPPPDDRVDVPLEVLLAAGEAVRSGRADVLDELARRADAEDPGGLRDQLVRLHTAAAGRLVATVATRESATPRLGWVSWVLFGDGWRSLTPLRQEGRPIVRLAPAAPPDLGAQVAALVTRVRGRS